MPYLRIHLYKTWFSFCLYQEDPRSNENKGTPEGMVTNYGAGGATQREGGACEVLPLQKGGAEKVSSRAEGETQNVLGQVLRGSVMF